MARKLTTRETTLVVGLGLLALVWFWRSSNSDAPAGESGSPRGGAAGEVEGEGGGARPSASTGSDATAPKVHMEQLAKALVKYDPAGHDLFRYSQRPPSMAELRRLKEEAARLKKEQELAAKKAAEDAERQRLAMLAQQEEQRLHPTPPPAPQPPAVTFQFVGFIGPPGDRIAALQQNNDTFLAKKGEVVQKFFKVEDIRYESVVLSYTDPAFKGQSRELPLSRGK